MPRPDDTARWIAAELHGSRLRAWQMQGGSAGGTLETDGLHTAAAAMQHLAGQWPEAAGWPVLLSGAAEAPLTAVPAKPADLAPAAAPDLAAGLWLLPGLSQAAPAAVMRSAPARIEGFLALNKDWDGVVCLPGDTTHWVLVSAGEVVSFQSFRSAALCRLAAPETAEQPDNAALAEAVSDVMSRPERLAARLAEAEARRSLGEPGGAELSGRIWGSFLGAELAAARPYWLGQNLALIAEGSLAQAYQQALEAQGLQVTLADPARMSRAGICAARSRAKG